MRKTGLKQRRIFSIELKKAIVKDIEKGRVNVSGVMREYGISGTTVYKWIKKFSTYLQPSQTIVVEMKSEQYKSRELSAKVKELEAVIGRKQMEIDYLEKLLEVAGEELKMDLKKNFATSPLTGSGAATKSGGALN
ncbi:MAG: transposase [Chitinophagaceae bacterium]|jgi:transposase-like protein|nr:transposase [Chitinophagaceae bacterium]